MNYENMNKCQIRSYPQPVSLDMCCFDVCRFVSFFVHFRCCNLNIYRIDIIVITFRMKAALSLILYHVLNLWDGTMRVHWEISANAVHVYVHWWYFIGIFETIIENNENLTRKKNLTKSMPKLKVRNLVGHSLSLSRCV